MDLTDDFRRLFENGFRNVNLPPLTPDDVQDISECLERIIQDRISLALADAVAIPCIDLSKQTFPT